MIYLRSIGMRAQPDDRANAFPFSIPTIASLEHRDVRSEVLLLVGENGSGKSTLLEALAIASRRVAVAGEPLEGDETLDGVRPLAMRLRLVWSRRTQRGFFLRAEDFFNFSRRQRSIAEDMQGLADGYDDPRVKGYMLGQKSAMLDRYGGDLDTLSHGESFLRLFQSRVVPGGLYLLDEPEAALSPSRQLAFGSFVKQMVGEGCQFIIATHSPLLMSYPDAAIWEFSDGVIADRPYAELEQVRLTRDMLASPERYWRQL